MNIARRRTVARGIAALSLVALITAPAWMASAAAGAPSNQTAHRVIHRPGTPQTTLNAQGRRVVAAPKDSAASVKAAKTAKAAAASAGSTSFSYVSQAGDYIGQGRSATLTPSADVSVAITGTQNHLSLSAHNTSYSTWWSADLSAGAGDTLHPGVYRSAERDPFRTGRSPGLDASGEGRGCNEVYGSFTVNQIAFDSAGALSLADVTFVQHCESASAPTFTGTIHLNQFPLGYKQVSDTGDYVGAGVSKSYLGSTSVFGVSGDASRFTASVSGQRDWWNGTFEAPTGQTLTTGKTYATARFADATHAGLDWGGDGRGCNQSTGSLTIQKLTVAGGKVTALRATFEQHCEGATPALHGTLRWFA